MKLWLRIILAVSILLPLPAYTQLVTGNDKEQAELRQALNLLRKADQMLRGYNPGYHDQRRPIVRKELTVAIISYWKYIVDLESDVLFFKDNSNTLLAFCNIATLGTFDQTQLRNEVEQHELYEKRLPQVIDIFYSAFRTFKPDEHYLRSDKDKLWSKLEAEMLRRQRLKGILKR